MGFLPIMNAQTVKKVPPEGDLGGFSQIAIFFKLLILNSLKRCVVF
jgi:hypothetical protein